MKRRFTKAFSIFCICMLFVSCSAIIISPVVEPTAEATLSGKGRLTPEPSPSPLTTASTPSPSKPSSTAHDNKPTETPSTSTPAPTPSPTPDPWAGMFSTHGAYVDVADPDNGPWIYKDETLSIRIDLISSGYRKYCKAEIYTRGPLPFGGLAYHDMTGHKKALPYLIDRQYQAVLGITADTVTWPGNPKGVMIRNGKVFYDKSQAPTMAIMPDGGLKVFEPGKTNAKQLLGMGVENSFAFGPILVKDGKVDPDVYTNRLKVANWRAAIGEVGKGHYICIVTIGGYTLSEMAQLFLQNNCTLAYNMDGGHSASMVFMGEQIYREGKAFDNLPQRPLTDILLIGNNPNVPGVNAPVYCDGVTKNKKYRPKPTNGPIG